MSKPLISTSFTPGYRIRMVAAAVLPCDRNEERGGGAERWVWGASTTRHSSSSTCQAQILEPRLLASSIESSRVVVDVPTKNADAKLASFVVLLMRMSKE